MEPWLIGLIVALGLLLVGYLYLRVRFEGWKAAQRRLWEREKEEALRQSRATLGGKFTEQLAPYLPEFGYDPTEARFLGTPIDLMVFPGLASDSPREIVFLEIKSGGGGLTARERKIKELVEAKKVRWELMSWRSFSGRGSSSA